MRLLFAANGKLIKTTKQKSGQHECVYTRARFCCQKEAITKNPPRKEKEKQLEKLEFKNK